MADIVVTRPLIDGALAGLHDAHTVTVHDAPGDRDEAALLRLAHDADALVTTVDDPVTARVFDERPNLRIVAQYGVGVDNIDLEAARANDVVVTHAPGALTDATADFTWALLLAVARHIPAADAYVRDGRFERWETTLLLGTELSGKRLGIVGMGRIGAAVARRALGFGMDVVYHNRSRANPTVERQTTARYVDLDTLLTTSDVVTLHCPHNEASHHLIDAAALDAMKTSALLVNTARGPVVDESALVDALDAGAIAGAGLDVFEREPEVHAGLFDHDRVVLAPHLASATTEARTRMGQMCVEALLAFYERQDTIPYRLV